MRHFPPVYPTPRKHDAFTHAVSMLGQRQRQWANIKTELGECLLFAGLYYFNPCPARPVYITPFYQQCMEQLDYEGRVD